MNLNHLDLQVSDVSSARAFFETVFGLRCVYQRRDELALLEDDAGFSLGVSNLFGRPAPVYPPDFHIGFVLAREADVHQMYERVKAAGVPLKMELAIGGPNVFFMCAGPDSVPVEVRAARDAE